MKLLKKSFLISLFIILTCACMGLFGLNTKKAAHADFQAHNFSKYLNIYSASSLTDNNVYKLDNLNYSIVSNESVSISPNLFEYRFTFSESSNTDFTNFKLSYSEPIILNDNEGSFDIVYGEKHSTYYYTINEHSNKDISDDELSIYTSYLKPNSSLKIGSIKNNYDYGIAFNPKTREMTYITYITCTYPNDSQSLKFDVYDRGTYNFTFHFEKPIAEFTNQEEQVVKFKCLGVNAGSSSSGYNPTWLPSERTYSNVTIRFFRNYTENNPLFFNINQNGFTYFYKIFTKDGVVHLQYTDQKLIINETTKQTSTEIVTTDKTYLINNGTLSVDNTFNIEFYEIGRYELEFYDLTYNQNLSQEDNYKNNANYYKTSFYIYDESKTYENVYLVAESYVNNQPSGYIISNSAQTATLNNDIRVTFKNLYNLNREDFEKIKITVTKTLFTGSVSSTTTEYTHENEFMNNCYENKADFYLNFQDDARYKINVYYSGLLEPLITSSYEVVKLPKTLFQVGNEGDPYYDRYVQDKLYTKTEKTYKVPLSSQIILNISYKNSDNQLVTEPIANSIFEKTFINEFKIFFGISQINISKYSRIIKEGTEERVAETYDIRINTVGAATVTVTFNDEKRTTYTFSEYEDKVLSFSEFGSYKIHVVDEMGTTQTASFNYEKKINTSGILLIVLSLILILGIVIFVMRSRAKVGTR